LRRGQDEFCSVDLMINKVLFYCFFLRVIITEYGIPGKILYTPGHSMGSVSVLLETGDAFVGDLAMSEFPLRLSPGLPILAEDMQQVKESWKRLMEAGAKTIYPAHGKSFPVEIIYHERSMFDCRR